MPVFMLILEISVDVVHVEITFSIHGIIELNPVLLHVNNNKDPVDLLMVNGDEQLVKLEDVDI